MYFLMHTCRQAPLPLHHPHLLCLRHSCTTRWQSSFRLKSVQKPQPFFYQRAMHPWCVCPPQTYCSQWMPCPVPPEEGESPNCRCRRDHVLALQQALQPRGQAGECRGSEMASQGKNFQGIPEIISFPLDSLFLHVFSGKLKWWCPAAPSNQWLSEGVTHQSLRLSSLPNTSVLIHMHGKNKTTKQHPIPHQNLLRCYHNAWKPSPLGSWLD